MSRPSLALGKYGRRWQSTTDLLTIARLAQIKDAAVKLTGIETTSSALMRYAIGQLLEESRYWIDGMSEGDQQEVRQKLAEARTCRPAENDPK